jgi:hypothetical protein
LSNEDRERLRLAEDKAAPNRLMRIIGPNILPATAFLAALYPEIAVPRHKLSSRRDRPFWYENTILQKFAHQFQRGMRFSLGPDQHIKDLTLGVDVAPQSSSTNKTTSASRGLFGWAIVGKRLDLKKCSNAAYFIIGRDKIRVTLMSSYCDPGHCLVRNNLPSDRAY